MSRILAINEGMNSSVVVCENGNITFALQEERVSRIKNFTGFPRQAILFMLDYLKLQPADFDSICFSNLKSGYWTKEEYLAAYDLTADEAEAGASESDIGRLMEVAKGALKKSETVYKVLKKLEHFASGKQAFKTVEDRIREIGFTSRVFRTHHHLNHAASAYFGLRSDPNEPHLVLSLDGGGDDACAQVYIGRNGKLEHLSTTPTGHSIGNIYSRVTHLMGMTPHEHEYKLMGLSAYADRNKYTTPLIELFSTYLDLDPDDPLRFKKRTPESTFALQPRLARDLKRVRFDNIAAGIQFFTEDLLVRWVQAAVKRTGIRKIVASGGVFMNVKGNQKIAELPEVDYFDVFPSCGDETLPFGAAWQCYASAHPDKQDGIKFDSFYLGPDGGYDLDAAIKKYSGVVDFKRVENPENETARLINEGKIVARCSGKMEFGARALGNRSLLADPKDQQVVPEINKMIKQRDFWMPFAPAMAREGIDKYVRIPGSLPLPRISPWMMHTFDTTEARNGFVAGIHAYDHTARAQVVGPDTNPGFHKVIHEFSRLSGRSVVLNTSFNLHGYPIVMGAADSIEVMMQSSLNYLIVNDHLITKRTQ